MTFVTNSSQALSVGTTATKLPTPVVEDASGSSPGFGIRKGKKALVKNTHATQILYVRRGATASSSEFDAIVNAGEERGLSLGSATYLSIIASGAATTGSLHWGDIA